MLDGFDRDPAWFFTGDQRGQAVLALRAYSERYTGSWFDRLADSDHPDQITAQDIVAVSTLSVDIPPGTSIWLLSDGAAQVSALLRQIPPEQAIWDPDADMTKDGPAWQLWNLIRQSRWPQSAGGNGMGTTKISKLMASKRPTLIPIHDSYIQDAVFGDRDPGNYWEPWTDLHRSADGTRLRQLADDVRKESGVGAHLSILRVIDIVVWHWAEQHLHSHEG
jgi:hypothetical protein